MMRLGGMMVIAVVGTVAIGCSPPPIEGRSAIDPVIQKAGVTFPVAAGGAISTGNVSIDLPPYEPVADLAGTITSIGTSTTTNLVARVAVQFRRTYPGVTLQVTASPISIGPAALLDGRADIVPMSRPLSPEEVEAFEAKYGYPPTEIKVAADALAIYVEKGNPVTGLTLGQLEGIFSQTQRPGVSPIETWDQAGLTAEWVDRRITLYGYGPEDGAHHIFQQLALNGGAFRLSMRVEGGGSSIVQGVAADPGAIGFASIFYACKRVRVVPLAGADGQFYAPTEETIRNHRYPLIRFLTICVNKPPGQPLSGPAAEYLRFLLSRDGQRIVADGGNISLNSATAEQGRRALAE